MNIAPTLMSMYTKFHKRFKMRGSLTTLCQREIDEQNGHQQTGMALGQLFCFIFYG
jgi:hypothetical protein